MLSQIVGVKSKTKSLLEKSKRTLSVFSKVIDDLKSVNSEIELESKRQEEIKRQAIHEISELTEAKRQNETAISKISFLIKSE